MTTPDASRLHELFDRYWSTTMAQSPERATAFGWPGFDDRWTDWSTAGVDERHAQDRATIDALRAVDAGHLDPDDALSIGLLIGELELRVAGQRFPAHLMPI